MPMYSAGSTATSNTLFKLTADAGQVAAPGSTSEVILAGCQFLMPANTLSVGKKLRIVVFGTKSGGTVEAQLRLRVGTAGTVADAAMNNGFAPTIVAANLSFGAIVNFRVASTTSLRRMGNGGVGVLGAETGQSNTARPAADTIANISNPLYFTLTCAMAAGTPEFVGIQEFEISVI